MLSKGQKTDLHAWLPPKSFLIWGELSSRAFLTLGFYSVKKDAIFSLGVCCCRELSAWARDGGGLKEYVMLNLARPFVWAGLDWSAGQETGREGAVCSASLDHKSIKSSPISFRQGCCPQHPAAQADVADLQMAQRWVRFRLRFKAANCNGNFTIRGDGRFSKEVLQLICVGVG